MPADHHQGARLPPPEVRCASAALALIVLTLPLLVAPAHPQDKANPPRKEVDPPADKVKALRKERIATLKQLVDSSYQLFLAGRGEFIDVADGQVALVRAELELAETGAERVAIYESAVKAVKTYEEAAQSRRTAGRGNTIPVLRAKAMRLEFEIALEKETAKPAKENK